MLLLKTDRVHSKGFAITCALQFLAALFAIILTMSYRLENKRRDRLYGKPEPNATVDTTELADKVCIRVNLSSYGNSLLTVDTARKAPDFRYIP